MNLRAALRLLFGLVLLVAVAWWLVPDEATVRDVFAQAELRPTWLAIAFFWTFAASVVTSLRWQKLSEATGGNRLPYVAYFYSLVLTRVLGQFSSTLVMDLVGRGVALRSAGSQRGIGHALALAVLERIFDLVLPVMLFAWAVAVHRAGWDEASALASFAGVCVVFAGFAALMLVPLARLVLRAYEGSKRLVARLRHRESAEPPLEVPTLDRRLATTVGLLGLARYLTVMMQFWAIATAVGVDVSWFQIAASTPLAQMAGMLGVTPGALGIQEAGWAGALTWVGVASGPIALFVLSQRLIATANFAVLSLISYPLLRRARAGAKAAQTQTQPRPNAL